VTSFQREPIIFVGTSDLSGHFRGKSFPVSELPSRLAGGVGLAPTNLFLSAFGPIHSTPFGTLGEVFLIPDPATRVDVPFEGDGGEHFMLCDIVTLEGAPWSHCPRTVLRRALQSLHAETGLRLFATFEQEFTYGGVPAHPAQPYELHAYRQQGLFGETLLGVLRQAGVVPDSFLAEFGPRQFEVTTAPAIGLGAADEAVITRELTQAVAYRFGSRACFAPLPELQVASNGTHIHWSFLDDDDRPAMYDPAQPLGLSVVGSHFVAGVVHHLPTLCAVTAPSVASYYRLRPNRWAPVRADWGVLDRGTSIRICPSASGDPLRRARQFNIEYRVADATASPYLALAMLVQAGLDGVRERRPLESKGFRALPSSLLEALALLEANEAAEEWMGADLTRAYIDFKRGEIKSLEHLEEDEICRRYAEVY
jgi:glutamine synthetase